MDIYDDLVHQAMVITCAKTVEEEVYRLDAGDAQPVLAAAATHLGRAIRRAVDAGRMSPEAVDSIIEGLRETTGAP